MKEPTSSFSIFTSKKGFLTCRVNGILLHSQYNPHQEAIRTIKNQIEQVSSYNDKKKLNVLVGSGLGYDVEAVQTFYPNIPILGIYFQQDLYDRSNIDYKILYSDNTNLLNTLRVLLRHQVPCETMQEINIFYWPTSFQIWKSTVNTCIKELKAILSIHFSEKNTVQHFISQWIRNATFHYLHIDDWYIPTISNSNIIITAAGPSLNKFLLEIKEKRQFYIIIAISSSLQCLFSHQIYPDIIVHQDSSYYASQYLSYFPNTPLPPIAFPLYASRSHTLRTHKSIILNTNQEIESLLQLPNHTINISSHGTVLGSALELAWKITNKQVYLIGFDLCIDTSGNHCFPHFSLSSAKIPNNKLHPLATEIGNRYFSATHVLDLKRYGRKVRQDLSLKAYSDWFSRWNHPWISTRTFALSSDKEFSFPHHNKIPILHSLPTFSHHTQPIVMKKYSRPPLETRLTTLHTLLEDWSIVWKNIKHNSNEKYTILSPSDTQQQLLRELYTLITEEEFQSIIHNIRTSYPKS